MYMKIEILFFLNPKLKGEVLKTWIKTRGESQNVENLLVTLSVEVTLE